MSPGSALWLLRHELRLQWRRRGLRGRALAGGVLLAALGLAAAQAAGLGAAWLLQDAVATRPGRVALANAALLGAGALMLAHAIDAALAAVFERRDLDWLLASPLPFRRVLAVRLLGVAATVAGPWLLLGGVVANGLAAWGQPGWLAAYPVVGALGLLAAAVGTGLAVGMVAGLGLRRARRVVGALGLVLSGLAFLGSQSAALLPPALQAAAWQALAEADGWPAQALLGEPGPLLAAVLLGLGAAAGAARGLERRFAEGAALIPATRPRRGAGQGMEDQGLEARRFRRGMFGALLQKELRLLRRTPNLLGRAAYQLVYVAPVAAAAWQGRAADGAVWLGTVSVFVAGGAARLLIAAAADADEAAELAATAPVPPGAVRIAKMAAAGLGAAGVVALPVLAAAGWRPGLLPALLGGVAGAVASGLLLGVWRPAPARRGDLGAKAAGWRGVGLLGTLLDAAWTSAAALAMRGSAWAALPAGLALAVLALARPRQPVRPQATAVTPPLAASAGR